MCGGWGAFPCTEGLLVWLSASDARSRRSVLRRLRQTLKTRSVETSRWTTWPWSARRASVSTTPLLLTYVLKVRQWLCGSVPDLLSGGCGFESRPGLLRIKVYSAFHPSLVGKWVPAAAGKAKAGMAHSDCGWTCGCAGKTVWSLENTCHTWALPKWWFMKRRYVTCHVTFTFSFTWIALWATLYTSEPAMTPPPIVNVTEPTEMF